MNSVVVQGCTLLGEMERVRFLQLSEEEREVFTIRIEQFVGILGIVYLFLSNCPSAASLIPPLMKNIFDYCKSALGQTYVYDSGDQFTCPYESTQSPGRPRYAVGVEQVAGLRGMGFTWRAIANILNVSERTLRRRRKEFDMPSFKDEFSSMTDEEVDHVVREILTLSPNSGERMVIGSIRSRGLKLSRERLRASINRVDPVSRALRRQTCVVRRRYNVKGPNSLW